MAGLSIAWDVDHDPEGMTWTAHEAGRSGHPLGYATESRRGWHLEVVDQDGNVVDAGEVGGSDEDAIGALVDLLEQQAARYVGRYVGAAGMGAYHLLTDRKPAGAGWDHPFWSRRAHRTACGRVIETSATSDRYTDGTPVPVCRRCERKAASSGLAF